MTPPETRRSAVLGAGSWGTALAVHLGGLGHRVSLWGRDDALIGKLRERRVNDTYLPEIILPPVVEPVSSVSAALSEASHVIVAVPSHGLRDVLRSARSHIRAGAVMVSATKA